MRRRNGIENDDQNQRLLQVLGSNAGKQLGRSQFFHNPSGQLAAQLSTPRAAVGMLVELLVVYWIGVALG